VRICDWSSDVVSSDLWFHFAFAWPLDTVHEAFLLGVGDCLLQRVEAQAELGAGVGRRSPAHQGLDLARGAGLEFHDPFAQARAAGLHGTLRRLKDPYLHGADRKSTRLTSSPY